MSEERDAAESSYGVTEKRQANTSAQWKTKRDTFFGIGLLWTFQTDGSRPIARNDTPSYKHRAMMGKNCPRVA